MVILKPLKTGPRLKVVEPLGPYEINAGALTKAHEGALVAYQSDRNTVTGRLMFSPPQESLTKPLLILTIGRCIQVAVHPGTAIMVIPETHKLRIFVEPRETAAP